MCYLLSFLDHLFTPSPDSVNKSSTSDTSSDTSDSDYSNQCNTANNSSDDQSSDSQDDANSSNLRHIESEMVAKHNINKGDLVLWKCDINTTTMCITNQQILNPQITHQKVSKRARRDCPYKGCTATQLLKLSNHLRQTHGLKNKVTIQKYLKRSKLV